MLQAVGIVAIAAIFGAAAGLHVRGPPWLWTDGPQEGGRVACARADLHIVRLQQGAALLGPVILQFKDDVLKAEHG